LLAKQRKHHGEDQGVRRRSGQARLSRAEHARGARREGQQHTRAENQEEKGGDDEVGLRQHQLHRARHEGEHEEKDQRVEQDGGLAGGAVHELDAFARGREEHARAESEKKRRREGNFRRRDVREHLLYGEIIYVGVFDHEEGEVIERRPRGETEVFHLIPQNAPHVRHILLVGHLS
jgi:hypothetical protein